MILVRCIYRLVEHTGNTSININNMEILRDLSPVLRYEIYFYIFESTLMLLNSILWNIWNPARYFPRDYHIYLAQDGTEIEGQVDLDERPLLAKTAHLLTFGVFFGRKRSIVQAEELAQYTVSS